MNGILSIPSHSRMGAKNIIFVHADDCGLHQENVDRIFACIEHGCLNSLSMICTTNGFEYGVNRYRKITGKTIRVHLHLNLVEGKPISRKEEVSLIVDENGEFKYSFLTLWLKYWFSNSKHKAEIKRQFRMEILAQMNKFKSAYGQNQPIGVDSHMHLHMVPFIFDTILEIADQAKIQYIRNPYEQFYFSLKDLKNYFSANIIKHFLLNYLSKKQFPRATKKGMQSNAFFIGVLATGNTTQSSVASALAAIQRSSMPFVGAVEVLFHPGGISHPEKITWTTNQVFKQYHPAIARHTEAQVITSNQFKDLVTRYENIFNHG